MDIFEIGDETPKRRSNGQLDNVQSDHEEEIPPDKINWPITLTLLLHHLLALHALMLVVQGQVLWSTIIIGEEKTNCVKLPCVFEISYMSVS